MSVLRLLCALMTIHVFVTLVFVSPILANNDEETASHLAHECITAAESTIISVYKTVLEAEQAGGNVTGLLAQLNEAGGFLATARMLYRNGDFNNATHFANLSKNTAVEVENAAYALNYLAWNESFQRMLVTMLGSISSILLVVLGSLWIWSFFKRRYQ